MTVGRGVQFLFSSVFPRVVQDNGLDMSTGATRVPGRKFRRGLFLQFRRKKNGRLSNVRGLEVSGSFPYVRLTRVSAQPALLCLESPFEESQISLSDSCPSLLGEHRASPIFLQTGTTTTTTTTCTTTQPTTTTTFCTGCTDCVC
jgi:hypothetical protein